MSTCLHATSTTTAHSTTQMSTSLIYLLHSLLLPCFSERNQNEDGSPLTFGFAMKGPNLSDWIQANYTEMASLFDQHIFFPIHASDKPSEVTATYYNPRVKEKLGSDGRILRRVRGTFGGDRIKNYPYPKSSQVADAHQNSVLADCKKGILSKCATWDATNYYLG